MKTNDPQGNPPDRPELYNNRPDLKLSKEEFDEWQDRMARERLENLDRWPDRRAMIADAMSNSPMAREERQRLKVRKAMAPDIPAEARRQPTSAWLAVAWAVLVASQIVLALWRWSKGGA